MNKAHTSNRILTIGDSTDQGSREYQDDNCGHRFEADGNLLAVLADGMGGYFGGAVASKLAVENFGKSYRSSKGRIPDRLENALNFANTTISEQASSDSKLCDMGTTLIAVSLSPGVLYWISVGDSLLYLIRKGKLIQLNTEHSLKSKMEDLFAKGKISKEELVSLKNPSALTSSLGHNLIKEIDNPKVPMALLEGDRLVMASDGILTLSESKIISIVTSLPTPQKAAESLINLVLKEGKKNQDNVTVMVIHHEQEKVRVDSISRSKARQNKLYILGIAGLVVVSFLTTLFFINSGNVSEYFSGESTANNEASVLKKDDSKKDNLKKNDLKKDDSKKDDSKKDDSKKDDSKKDDSKKDDSKKDDSKKDDSKKDDSKKDDSKKDDSKKDDSKKDDSKKDDSKKDEANNVSVTEGECKLKLFGFCFWEVVTKNEVKQ